MANYFKDLRSGAKNLYRQAKGNATLKGIDDHFDRVSAGGGKGVGDFLLDMSGIADMYQVGKQGAHIADDMYDGVDWDDIDQGRKDALGRGVLGTALTLAPVPGFKMGRAGLRKGASHMAQGGRKHIAGARGLRARDLASKGLLPGGPRVSRPPSLEKMRKDLLEARFKGGKPSWKKAKHDPKWGGPAPTGTLGKGSSLKEASKIQRASEKDIRAAHKILKAEKAAAKSLDDVGESLGSKYMANASDNIFGKPHGLLKTPLRVATGGGLTGPLYRAGKVGLKDLYRGTPEGYEDSEDYSDGYEDSSVSYEDY